MTYAPIALFAYNRVDHLQQTYSALSLCPEAKQSDLFIFSDAAKNEKAENGVREVRSFLEAIQGENAFKSINIIKAAENKGLANSIIEGVTDILNRYGRIIVLEDDCLSSPYLLTFFNSALDVFKDDNRIGSVAGYTPDILSDTYNYDIFTAFRSCSCCWATWADRWADVDWDYKDRSLLKSPALIRKFNSAGADRFIRYYRQSKGNGNSWSVRFGAHLVKNNQLTVYPKYSYIQNIGCDDTGVHSQSDDAEKMRVDLSKAIPEPKIEFVEPDSKIISAMKKHYSGGLVSDMKRSLATAAIIVKENLR